MTYPTYTREEALSRETFLALMWSLSYPGRIYTLPDDELSAFQLIGDTLLDIETSFFTPDQVLVPHLARNGARELPPERAAYHFYPTVDGTTLTTLEQAHVGTMTYPDSSATIIIGCAFGGETALELAGPGIPPEETRSVAVTGIEREVWKLREQASRYPLGWDMLLVAGRQVIGLPRTTQITVKGV